MDWFAPLRATAWGAVLGDVLAGPEAARLSAFLDAEISAGETVLPPAAEMFRAYELVAPEAVRVVIVGQDPYPTPGHAHGLAFSYVGDGTLPRSLANIFKELERDLALPRPEAGGDLSPWARQGVLLLNRVLTVRAGEAGSHRRRGFEALTAATIEHLCGSGAPIVFLLWGNDARRLAKGISAPHHVLEAGHPSPLSIRYFKGCGHFSQANALLGERGVDWGLRNHTNAAQYHP